MKTLKEQKSNVEIVKAVDVELNEEQLDVVAGGVWGDCTGGIPDIKIKGLPDVYLPKAPGIDESI